MNTPVPEKLKYIPEAEDTSLQAAFDRIYKILNDQHNKLNEILDYLATQKKDQTKV